MLLPNISAPILRSNSELLPWGDINVFVVTDVHSWVAGHGRHEADDADYGDVLSFYQLLKQQNPKRDIFFVMNGDFMDGTGLSTIPPSHLLPILMKMPWDAVNLGNHELYHAETVAYMEESGFIQHWKGNYLTTNTYWANRGNTTHRIPLGARYTYLWAPTNEALILTFGFLYNFQDNCNTTFVQRVQETVQESWFRAVLNRRNYDAILVLAHMDHQDPLVKIIRQAIRSEVGDTMPIQFINGHSHRRGFTLYDSTSSGMEAGRFLDTVGFVSFPTSTSVMKARFDPILMQHKFLNTRVDELRSILGVHTEFSTADGSALKLMIHDTQNELGLNSVIGCSPHRYLLSAPVNESDSLWKLFLEEVIPTQLSRHNSSIVFFGNSGDFRYDLFGGEVIVDDVYAVSPFNDTILQVVDNIPGIDLLKVLDALSFMKNRYRPTFPMLMPSIAIDDVEVDRNYGLYSAEFDAPLLCQIVEKAVGNMSSCQLTFRQGISSENNPINLSMTTIWFDFVKEQWPCGYRRRIGTFLLDTTMTDQRAISMAIFVPVALLVSGLMAGILGRRATKRTSHASENETTPLRHI